MRDLLVRAGNNDRRAAPIVFGPRTLHGTPGQVWRGAPVLFPVGPLRGAELSARAEVSRRTAGLTLEFDSSGELESSGGQCSGGLFEEGGLHVSDVGGVVRSIGDVEGVYCKREREGLV